MKSKVLIQLMQSFDQSSLQHLEFEQDGSRLLLSKAPVLLNNVAARQELVQDEPAALPQMKMESATVVAETRPDNVDSSLELVTIDLRSPIVGTFYAGPEPGKPAFVSLKQKVNKGDTVCVIEAMKTLLTIEAPVSGYVAEILVANEEFVDFDRVLMRFVAE